MISLSCNRREDQTGYSLGKTLLQRSSPTVANSFKVSALKYGPVLTSNKDNLVSSLPWNKEWGPKMNSLSCSEREETQEGRMIIELRNVHANRELLILFVGKTY